MQSKVSIDEIRSHYSPISTVFGSSSVLPHSPIYKLSEEVGSILATKGYTVASGGYGGIMDGVSKGANKNGGKILGITTDEITKIAPSSFLTQEYREPSLMSRLEVLIGIGDIYIFFPGSTGTLTELALVWDKQKLGLIPLRPIWLVSNMWQQISKLMFENNEVPPSTWKKERETAENTKYIASITEFASTILNLKI